MTLTVLSLIAIIALSRVAYEYCKDNGIDIEE
jgi:hypothetical protein